MVSDTSTSISGKRNGGGRKERADGLEADFITVDCRLQTFPDVWIRPVWIKKKLKIMVESIVVDLL
jgi:hypothetical protein